MKYRVPAILTMLHHTHQTLVLHLFALMSCGWFICTDLSPLFLMGIFFTYAQLGCKTRAD
jgi:hypothetical protein